MSRMHAPRGPSGLLLAALVPPLIAGCSLEVNVIGGRERCWPDGETRLTSLMKGTLVIDAGGARLATPEGEVLTLTMGNGSFRTDTVPPAMVDGGGAVMAEDGDLITVFGGLGGDASMIVCDVEERAAE
jgi:hypothetical protein